MNGTLVINKPADWTSHDVVAKLRRILNTRKIGHTGTLDPFATGVLVVCVGAATRLVQYLVGLEKEYVSTVRLGLATDTQDLTGEPISPLRTSNAVTAEDVVNVLAAFRGAQSQLPPMYSAKKVGGETLHRAARAGRVVERQPVRINVYEIEALDGGKLTDNEDGTRDFRMRVRCSSGTYIRTLAHDIGGRLGVGAHLATLHRTAVGHFTIAQALTLPEVEAKRVAGTLDEHVVSLSESVCHLPRLTLTAEDVLDTLHGRAIRWSAREQEEALKTALATPGKVVRLCNKEGNLLALGELDEGQEIIKPRVVFQAQKG